jgi:alpha-mannosidase
VLNLRFQIEKLVKNQRYIEAAQMKKKLSVLEDKNQVTNTRREIEKHENKFIYLKKKHENELFALEKKINIGKEEMIKAREKDFESIHLKFKVLKEKKEKFHRHERIMEEKRLKQFKPCSKYLFKMIQE